jgi:putative ABC transport system permease protein
MAEALLVALPAGVLAVLLSALTLPLFLQAVPEGIPRLDRWGPDLPTVAAAFALVVLAALGCGALPALHGSSPDFNRLREGSRGATRRRNRGRDLLVMGQTALALVLLIGSALLVQSFQRLRNVDAGYDTADIYTFQFAPVQEHLTGGPSWGRFHLDFMDRLRAIAGVTGVGVVENIPLDEGTATVRFLTDGMDPDSGGALLNQNFAGGDYFQVMGIDLLRGRPFTRDEAMTPNTHVIVSRSAAARLWPDGDPIGQRIRRAGVDVQWFTVVGVVADVKQTDWRYAGDATADGADRERLGARIARLRGQVAAGREPRPRSAGARAAGRAGGARIPRVHDGVPRRAVHGAAVVHHADPGCGRRARDRAERARPVRRALESRKW